MICLTVKGSYPRPTFFCPLYNFSYCAKALWLIYFKLGMPSPLLADMLFYCPLKIAVLPDKKHLSDLIPTAQSQNRTL